MTAADRIFPMLATSPKVPLSGDLTVDFNDDWVFETKYDGMRLIYKDGRLSSRIGTDSTARFPEIKVNPDIPGVVLDGEVIMLAADGTPDFNLIQRRTPSTAATDPVATYVVFDILALDGDDLTEFYLTTRRAFLENLVEVYGLGENVILAPQYTLAEAPAVMQDISDRGLEGMIAKYKRGMYIEDKRSREWVKIKKSSTISCVVIGALPGKGKRGGTFGALELGLYDPRTLSVVPVGSVGTGFTDAELDRLLALMDSTDDDLIVEIACMEMTKAGQLRFPVYKGVRDDVLLENCLLSQISKVSNGS